jgi:hypothetical protein
VRDFVSYHPSIEKVVFVCHGSEAYGIYLTLLGHETPHDRESAMAGTALSHLLMIEMSHGIRIRNKEEIARTIARVAKDDTSALSFGISLNNWVAVSGARGVVTIPDEVLSGIIKHLKET